MSILVNKHTKVITQGMTGKTGEFHTKAALDYGTLMVAAAVNSRDERRTIPVFSESGPTMNPGVSTSEMIGRPKASQS